MEYRVRVNWLGAAAVLAAGVVVSIVTSTVVAARAYESRAKKAAARAQDITVKGTARTRVRSDTAVWAIDVRGEGTTLPEAFAALEAAAERVGEFLRDRGFGAADIVPAAIDTDTHFVRDEKGQATRQVAGYGMSRRFTVTTAEVERVAAAAGEVTQLLRDGVVVISGVPAYTYSKVNDLKVAILGDAAKDARARADEIAGKAGCRVTDVRGASQGVIQITQPNSTEVSSYGQYDTGTIEKDVSVVVTLTFGIEG